MADTRFTCGRYAKKTYEEVVKLDPSFCRDAMRHRGEHKYYPEDFKQYCRSVFEQGGGDANEEPISERNAHHFIDAVSQRPHLFLRFRNMIGNPRIHKKVVHDELHFSVSSGFLGVFHRFFLKKCIFNLQKVCGFNQHIEEYATIFPFKVNPNLSQVEVPVKDLFDDRFMEEITVFLSSHFENVQSEVTVDAFLSNIFCFRRDRFSEPEIEELENRIDNLKTQSIENRDRNFVIRYLENFPRLNGEGVLRYQCFGKIYEEMVERYGLLPVDTSKNDSHYLLHLPEINIHEMFSLLQPNFYTAQRPNYLQLFSKYIFFFEHARRSERKPVFFIDDFLFECLKYLAEYQRSANDPLTLKKALVAITLVHRRKQSFAYPEKNVEVDDAHLLLVQKYVAEIPHIESAVVEPVVETDILAVSPLFVANGTLYDMCVSRREHQHIYHFFKVILQGAFYFEEIHRLVIYNAFRGCEYGIKMPRTVEAIREFVRRHNRYDFSKSLPAEKFLTWGWETYFEPNTINWEEREESDDRL